jgi:hypothetical protein
MDRGRKESLLWMAASAVRQLADLLLDGMNEFPLNR